MQRFIYSLFYNFHADYTYTTRWWNLYVQYIVIVSHNFQLEIQLIHIHAIYTFSQVANFLEQCGPYNTAPFMGRYCSKKITLITCA